MFEGLGAFIDWNLPGVKTLRLMNQHPLLEGENLERKKTREALQKIRAVGFVLENWEGEPLN